MSRCWLCAINSKTITTDLRLAPSVWTGRRNRDTDSPVESTVMGPFVGDVDTVNVVPFRPRRSLSLRQSRVGEPSPDGVGAQWARATTVLLSVSCLLGASEEQELPMHSAGLLTIEWE